LQIIDDPRLRQCLSVFDKYPPKNCYCVQVTYVPRETPINVANIQDIECNSDSVSEAHLHFLSMLGNYVTANKEKVKDNHLSLYLKSENGLPSAP